MSKIWNFNGELKENGVKVVTSASADAVAVSRSSNPSVNLTKDENVPEII